MMLLATLVALPLTAEVIPVDLPLPDDKAPAKDKPVKGFLRRNGHRDKPASPSGHLSVWIEEVKLPPIALEAAAGSKEAP
jgi:hypothetical protein